MKKASIMLGTGEESRDLAEERTTIIENHQSNIQSIESIDTVILPEPEKAKGKKIIIKRVGDRFVQETDFSMQEIKFNEQDWQRVKDLLKKYLEIENGKSD